MATRKILVPVDGSPCALRAVRWAARKVQELPDTQLIVLYVHAPLPSSRLVTRTMIADHQDRLAHQALHPVRVVLTKAKVGAEFCFRTGEPGAMIAEFAQKSRCREIVMGTRGLGHVAGLLLGSVATKVIHLSKVPVTLVK